MAPGARFIASGIITERKDEVLTGLQAAGLAPIEVKESAAGSASSAKERGVKYAASLFTRELADGRAALTGSDAHHLADVMRAKLGEEVVLCGPDGLEYLGTVTAIEPGRVEFPSPTAQPARPSRTAP